MKRNIVLSICLGFTIVSSSAHAVDFNYCPAGTFSKQRVVAVSMDRYALGYFAFRTAESNNQWRYLDSKYGDSKENYEVAMLYTALNSGLKITYSCNGTYVIDMEMTVED